MSKQLQGGNPATNKSVTDYSISASDMKNGEKGYYQGFRKVKIKTLNELGELMLTHSLSSQLYGKTKTSTSNDQLVKYRRAINNINGHGQAIFFDIDNKVRLVDDKGKKIGEQSDPTPVTLEMITSRFKELGWGCVVTPSRSSTDEWEKFHIGAFISGDCGSHDEFREHYLGVVDALEELKLDEAMKNSVQNCTPAIGHEILALIEGNPIPFNEFKTEEKKSNKNNNDRVMYDKNKHNLHLESDSNTLSLEEMISLAEQAKGSTVRCGCHNDMKHGGDTDSGCICQLNSDGSIHSYCRGCDERKEGKDVTVWLRDKQLFTKKEGKGLALSHSNYELPVITKNIPHKFNIDLLPKDVQKFVSQGAMALDNSPSSMFGVGVMIMLGNAIGRRVGVKVKQRDSWTEYPNFWGALIAPPSCKKSPIIKRVGAPMKHAEGRANDRYQEKLKEYKTEIEKYKIQKSVYVKSIKEGDSSTIMPEEPNAPTRERHIIDDATIEAVGQIMVDNPNGILLLKDELSGFFAKLTSANREGDRSFWLEAYTHQTNYNVDRVGRGNFIIPHVIAGIFGSIQPDVIQKLVYDTKSGATGGDGLLQRFQLSVIETQTDYKFSDTGTDRKDIESYSNLIDKILKKSPIECGAKHDSFKDFEKQEDKTYYYRFTKEATEVFKVWSEENTIKIKNEEKRNPALASHFGKYSGTFAKLALVLFYCDRVTGKTKKDLIDAKYARKTILWIEFLESHARVIYNIGVVKEEQKKTLNDKIITKVKEVDLPMSLGELSGLIRGAKKEDCKRALKDIAKIRGSKIIGLL